MLCSQAEKLVLIPDYCLQMLLQYKLHLLFKHIHTHK